MTEEGLSKKHKNTCPSKWWNTSIIKTLLSWNRNSSVGRQRHQRTGVCLTSLQPSVQTTGVSLNHLSLPLCTAQVLPVFHFPSAASLFPEHNGKVQCYFLVLNLIIRRFLSILNGFTSLLCNSQIPLFSAVMGDTDPQSYAYLAQLCGRMGLLEDVSVHVEVWRMIIINQMRGRGARNSVPGRGTSCVKAP